MLWDNVWQDFRVPDNNKKKKKKKKPTELLQHVDTRPKSSSLKERGLDGKERRKKKEASDPHLVERAVFLVVQHTVCRWDEASLLFFFSCYFIISLKSPNPSARIDMVGDWERDVSDDPIHFICRPPRVYIETFRWGKNEALSNGMRLKKELIFVSDTNLHIQAANYSPPSWMLLFFN